MLASGGLARLLAALVTLRPAAAYHEKRPFFGSLRDGSCAVVPGRPTQEAADRSEGGTVPARVVPDWQSAALACALQQLVWDAHVMSGS